MSCGLSRWRRARLLLGHNLSHGGHELVERRLRRRGLRLRHKMGRRVVAHRSGLSRGQRRNCATLPPATGRWRRSCRRRSVAHELPPGRDA